MTGLVIRHLSGALGVEIETFNAAAYLEDGVINALRAALVEHCVLLFQGQNLTPS